MKKDRDPGIRPSPPTADERRRSLARHLGALLALELLDERRGAACTAAGAPEPPSSPPGSLADGGSPDAGD